MCWGTDFSTFDCSAKILRDWRRCNFRYRGNLPLIDLNRTICEIINCRKLILKIVPHYLSSISKQNKYIKSNTDIQVYQMSL